MLECVAAGWSDMDSVMPCLRSLKALFASLEGKGGRGLEKRRSK